MFFLRTPCRTYENCPLGRKVHTKLRRMLRVHLIKTNKSSFFRWNKIIAVPEMWVKALEGFVGLIAVTDSDVDTPSSIHEICHNCKGS